MSTEYQVVEKCDRCGGTETIAYGDTEDLSNHKTTLLTLYLGYLYRREVCRQCFDRVVAFVTDDLAKAAEDDEAARK